MKHILIEHNMIAYVAGIVVTLLTVSRYVNAGDTAYSKPRPFRCSRPSRAPLIPSCPLNMVYMNCTPSCSNSCQNPNGMIGCIDGCTEPAGCVCPEGFMWKGSDCVIPEECGCFVSSEHYVITENEVYINDYCTKRCVCNSTGEFTCDNGYRCDDNATCDVRANARQCYCKDDLVGDGVTCTNPTDCQHILLTGQAHDGIYTIRPLHWSGLPFKVYCNMTIDGGGWTVFQRRVNGSVGFYRDWDAYKHGFGNLNHEFWLGNEKLFYLTNQNEYELRIDMVNTNMSSYYARYTLFRLSDAMTSYKLSALGTYNGTAGFDSMAKHRNMKFSTYDHDRDTRKKWNCAERYTGAWWYNKCHDSNLNGDYHGSEYASIHWQNLPGNQDNLQYTEMKIRSLRDI